MAEAERQYSYNDRTHLKTCREGRESAGEVAQSQLVQAEGAFAAQEGANVKVADSPVSLKDRGAWREEETMDSGMQCREE